MSKIFSVVVAAAVTVAVMCAPVQAGVFAIDPNTSNVLFKIQHMGGYYIGAFKRLGGYITLDDQTNALAAVVGRVDVTSVTTRNQARDEEIIRNADILNVQEYPTATFVGKRIENQKLIGDLTIRGKTREVAMDYWVTNIAQDRNGRRSIGLLASGTFDRNDFGIKYNHKLLGGDQLIGDDVELRVEAVAVLTDEKKDE